MRILTGGRYCLLFFLGIFFACHNQNVLALTASIGPDGCNAQALHALGFTGRGVLVGIFSQDHARVTHEAFYNKDSQGYPTGTSCVTYFDATGESAYETSYHDTAMAGIVGSRGGQLYPAEIGVAPGCSICSVRMVNSSSQISISYIKAGLEKLVGQGCRVAVTGIQFPVSSVTPDGSSQFSLIYDYYAYHNDMLFINAAGNDETSITVFGDGFNGITTGGLIMPEAGVYRQVGTASNPGPTTDGRRKPDISSPAQTLWVPYYSSDIAWANQGTTRGETSWAGPHAAGVAALLLQYANSSADTNDGHSEVIKAVMVNSTFPNIKNKTGQVTTNQTWNAQRGYGRVDAMRAYQTLRQPTVAKGTYISQSAGWAYQYVSQKNQSDTYWIYGKKNQRLVLTTTWHRAVSRNGTNYYLDETTPKFNLDMRIYDPQGTLVFSDVGTPDNLRKADILLLTEGSYKVLLSSNQFSSGRYYAMAFELLDPLEGDFNADSIVDSADMVVLADSWLANNCTNTNQACYGLDLLADGQIDFQDMAILSSKWLTIDPRYYSVP
jgi:hypothetical protein